jgi:hypothetical protein
MHARHNFTAAPLTVGGLAARRREAGFSLAEMVVSLFVLVVVLVAVLTLFDSSNRIARAQINVADMQQSIRIAQDEITRMTRMAARGGLNRGDFPFDAVEAARGHGPIAIAVRNNVAMGANQNIAIGDAASPKVMPLTDVLVVRGVFNAPLYQLNPAPGAGVTFDNDIAPTSGTIKVENPQPTTGLPQDLAPLAKVINDGREEALVLTSILGSGVYGVVELNPALSTVTGPLNKPTSVEIAFTISGGTRTDSYRRLDPNASTCELPPPHDRPCFPIELRSVAQVGILEEYRYYVRQVLTDPNNPNSEAKPRLSRARFYPGTETPYEATMVAEDIADDIIDLQVSLAIDRTGPLGVPDDIIGPEGGDDEWLFNDSADDQSAGASAANPAQGKWNSVDGTNRYDLFHARITTVARTSGRDFQHEPQRITKVEDHAYDSTAQAGQAQYRLRTQQTVIDQRNL